jgi:hypothetical protein
MFSGIHCSGIFSKSFKSATLDINNQTKGANKPATKIIDPTVIPIVRYILYFLTIIYSLLNKIRLKEL